MEGNNNFGFNPNNVGKMEGSFKDKNGQSKVVMQASEAPLNMPQGNITLANRPKVKTKVRTNPMLQDIGPKSQGFAGVALLAGIIAFAGIVVLYLVCRY